MAIPVNIDAAHATELTSFPANVSQNAYDAGTAFTYPLWFKFTAPAGATVVGVFGFGGAAGAGYRPIVKPYDGPAGAPVQILGIVATNKPIQFPVIPGNEYFLEFDTPFVTNPSNLTLNVQIFSPSLVPVGSIFITDDSEGFPAAVLSSVNGDDNNLLKFQDFPAGESGDALESGVICFHDDFESPYEFKVYNSTLSLLRVVTGFDGVTNLGFAYIRSCLGADCWYGGYKGSGATTAKVRRISAAGIIGTTLYDLGAVGLTALAARNDETVLYYSGSPADTNSNIKRWNLLTNTAMADLVADIGGGYIVTDILYLADDTLIVCYFNYVVDQDIIIKNINSTTGAVIHTYSLGGAWMNTFPRMTYAIDDPTSFWVFLHPETIGDVSLFRNYNVATGAVISEIEYTVYEGGVYEGVETATPTARFGSSLSCPIIILRTNTMNPGGGIYIVIPNKTFDELYTEDVNIPDPTFKTALLGD